MSQVRPKLTLKPINQRPLNLCERRISKYRANIKTLLGTTQLKPQLIDPLEESIYQKIWNDFSPVSENNISQCCEMYISLSTHLINNLQCDNDINNTWFIEQMNNETIKCSDAVNLTPPEMFPTRWKSLVEKRLYAVDKTLGEPESTTDIYWCGQCHRNKCTYFERQDRCADEPMTVHITCCFCGHRWKH
jgi:DNA-directed RNA polymerase subunit M/transcription elongation factor TFIIS